MAYEKSGVLVIDKPQEMTSHDVVAIVRRNLKTKKVGHTGTLDPMATGVLPVCIGKATKIVDFLMDRHKVYRCTMQLGAATDTQDVWGTITEKADYDHISGEDILRTLQNFVGEIVQIPPMYSAIKVGGQKLVDLARKGIEIEREPRKRFIEAIEEICIENGRVQFTVTCSKGTYIRTLCHDIGIKLGCYAHMTELKRLASEPFTLEQSISIEHASETHVNQALISIEDALSWMPKIIIPDHPEIRKRVLNGVSTNFMNYCNDNQETLFYRIFLDDTFYGVAEKKAQGIFMKKLMIG